MTDYQNCRLCPRSCSIDRTQKPGACGCTDRLLVSRAALHYWEEPCISGTGENAPGSGTVFFSGCALGCVFCQNHAISRGAVGKEITAERLCEIFLELEEKGAANINLVTGDHFLPHIEKAMERAKPRLTVPVAVNCSGYMSEETVRRFAAFSDIFMPDFKYFDPALSAALSRAPDYFEKTCAAVGAMLQHTGGPVFGEDGLLKRGVILRHLVLPGHRADSIALLEQAAARFGTDGYILSLMSQYTPYRPLPQKELNRRLSSFEYRKVCEAADRLGFEYVYTQQRSAAKEEYTPPFDCEGV